MRPDRPAPLTGRPSTRGWVGLPLLGATLSLALVAGCGTTVQDVSLQADGLGAVLPAASAVPGGQSGQSGAGTPVVSVPGAGPGGSTGASGRLPGRVDTSAGPVTGGRSGPVAGAVAARGPGWDEKNVYVGVVTQKDTQRVFASFGANNVDPGDTEQHALAVADAINAAGGILGRTLKIRFYDIKILEANQNPAVVGQAVCEHFAHDAPVIAVWNVSTQLDQAPTFRQCLAKARVSVYSTAARAVDDRLFSELAPYYYQSLMVSWTRLAPVFVRRLQAQGWFGGWNTTLGAAGSAPVVVGVLVEDEPQGRRTAAALKGALAAAGFRKVVDFAYDAPEEGQTSSVQYFKGNGVTHVVVADVELTAFQQAATAQGYKPRYGITSYNAPYPNLEASGFTPSGANNGAVGVGWAPGLDVSDANDPGPTPGWPRCKQLMTKRGQVFTGKRLALAYASAMCDALFAVDAGAEAGGGFTGDRVRAGIVSVAGRFPLAVGFGAALSDAAPYSAGVVRDLAWDTACSCMKYGRAQTRL